MKKTFNFIWPVILCLAVGFIAGRFQADSIENLYPYLNNPALTPPNIVFPIAWNILYICMGLSLGFILNSTDRMKKPLIILFFVQLLLNFAWSMLFFYGRNPFLGLVDIILLAICIIIYIFRSYSVSKISSFLFIPYILWVTFAAYLNLYIYVHN